MVDAVAGELGREGVHVLRRGYRQREQLQSVDQQSVRKLMIELFITDTTLISWLTRISVDAAASLVYVTFAPECR